MTLLELEQSLPNGLHDAQIGKIEIDYERRTVRIDLAVWVGDTEDSQDRREAYKNGSLRISGLLFIAMVTPDAGYPFEDSKTLCIDG